VGWTAGGSGGPPTPPAKAMHVRGRRREGEGGASPGQMGGGTRGLRPAAVRLVAKGCHHVWAARWWRCVARTGKGGGESTPEGHDEPSPRGRGGPGHGRRAEGREGGGRQGHGAAKDCRRCSGRAPAGGRRNNHGLGPNQKKRQFF